MTALCCDYIRWFLHSFSSIFVYFVWGGVLSVFLFLMEIEGSHEKQHDLMTGFNDRIY